jgi:transcriptional regulator with XRE-family HTH domain
MKRAQPPVPEIKVDLPGLKLAAKRDLQAALKARDDEWTRAVGDYLKLLDNTTRKFQEAAQSVRFRFPKEAKVLPPERGVVTQKEVAKAAPAVAAPPTWRDTKAGEHYIKAVSQAENNGDLSRPQLRILQALAEFDAIGRPQAPKKWIAAFAGVSHSSGSFGNNLGALRTAGHITYPAAGEVALTDSGRALVPDVNPPATSKEMLERCKSIMSGPQGRLLEELFHAHSAGLSKAQLAERVGVSVSSGSFGNNLGALRSAGMIEYPEPGKARAADWLYLE